MWRAALCWLVGIHDADILQYVVFDHLDNMTKWDVAIQGFWKALLQV